MRLHRIRLRDFRGVHDREVSLAEHGVTVLQGDNEVGKTSTLVALDLLFDAADSSRRAEIRAAQPAGVDAGPEVEAEVSTGPYRFVYRKRWLRRPRTELHVTAPAPEQLTGADAHARVTAILDETMDRALWRGLRVEQNSVVGQADLGGQDALTRALDRAASGPGVSRADPSADDGLIDRAAEELRRYRTPSGRATGELRAAEVRLADAEAEEARCRAALEAVERDVAARDRLDADAAALKARKHAHTAEVTGLEDTWAALQSRLREVDAARQHAVLARERADAARERRETRDALVAAVEDEADTAARAAEAVAAHEAEHAAARDERDARRAADTAARARASEARRAADAAERAVSAARDRVELADLAERLRRVDEAAAGLAAAERALAASTVDADDLDELEDLARDVVRAEAARDAAAARVELAVPDDAGELTVVVDGETVVLAPGGSRTLPVAGSRALSLPGVLDVRVTPGLDDAGRDDAVRERSRALAEACEDLGVADLEAARAARRGAEDAARRADEHRAALARELAGHGDAPALRAAHDAVRSRLPDDKPSATSADVTELRAAADTARADAEDAAHRADEADAACRSAEDTVREADTRAAVLAERAAEARHAHTRRLEELDAARAAEPDATLAEAETTRLARARDAEREHEAMAAALADDDPDTVEARVLNARAVAERLSGEGARLEREHAETTGRLQAAGLAGWHDQLAAAELELDAAEREHAAVARRAAAARRLHETLTRHRERVRRSYVAPFRAQVERLARIVFGPSLALEIDEDLRITHRTLDGTTVPFGALSSGAQEQLGLCARLACAALVDPSEGVPVVIDDALGHSDPERLARLGAVFTAATSAHGAAQVVVLTCTPERYHGIGAATVVPLAPSRRPGERAASERSGPEVVRAAEDTPAATPGTVLDLPRAPRAG